MPTEIMLPVGRMVQGHPMVRQPVTDKHGQPVFKKGTTDQRMKIYIGYAIAKTGEADWKQTEWGAKIVAQARTDWPNNESGAPTFAWKIIDGDSGVPNKKGKIPNQREGFPGHWILGISTEFEGVRCFHKDHYLPHEAIQNKTDIKCGDYVRCYISVKGNGPVSESPGVYLNPVLFELYQPGVEIVSDSVPDAAAAFGAAGAGALPPGAAVMAAGAAPATVGAVPASAPATAGAAPAPAHDFVANAGVPAAPAAPVKTMTPAAGGIPYEAYIAKGWSDDALVAHGLMQVS